MADNKININVEVVNNTKSSIYTIMADLKNMNASIQTSIAATNQLITASMQKSASTIQAANSATSTAAATSFENMQLNATKASEKMVDSFIKNANKTVEAIQKSSDAKITITKDMYNKSLSLVEYYTEKQKTMDKEVASVSAYYDSLILEGRKEDADKMADLYEKALKTEKDLYREAQIDIEIYIKESDKRLMSWAKDNNKNYISDYQERVNRQKGLIKELESNIDVSNNANVVSTIKHSNAMEQLAKRFLTVAAAIYLLRRAYQVGLASIKEYEEAAISQGKLSKDTAAGPRIDQSFKQIMVEAGSVLEPYMKTFADYMKTNASEIEASVRKSIDVMVNIVKLASGLIEQVANVIYVVMDGVMVGITALISGVFSLINNTIMKLPGISEESKKVGNAAVAQANLWTATRINLAETHAQDLVKSLEKVNTAFEGLQKSLAGTPKTSGVTAKTDTQKAAEAKRKQDMLAMEKWVKDLKDQAQESNLNEFEARQAKADDTYLNARYQIFTYEKQLHVDLTNAKIDAEKIYNTESAKIGKDQFDAKVKLIDDIVQKQKEAYKSAIEGAKSSGLINAPRKAAPGSPILTDITGSTAASNVTSVATYSYANQLEEMNKAYAIMEQNHNSLNSEIKVSDEQLSEARIQIEQYTMDTLQQMDYDATQARVDSISKTVDAYTQGASMIVEIANNIYQVQLNNISRETDERQKALDKSYANASKYVKNKGKLDKQQKEASDKLQDEQAAKAKEIQEKQKNAAIANALIAGAVATMNAWSSSMQMGMPAGLIMGIAMSVVIAALTATQIAVIESQKFAGGGIVQGPTTGDTVPIQANGGEMMLNTSQQASLWNMIASKSGSTSSSSNNINMAGDTYIVSGSLDKSAVSEIRRMKEERQMQLRSDIKELSYRNQLQLV